MNSTGSGGADISFFLRKVGCCFGGWLLVLDLGMRRFLRESVGVLYEVAGVEKLRTGGLLFYCSDSRGRLYSKCRGDVRRGLLLRCARSLHGLAVLIGE